MPVQIGAKTHSFSDPTALLSDCHRRIEMFVGTLQKIAAHIDQPLPTDARSALESSLHYFREAAPKHTADEEESVFPRLRQSSDPDMKNALTTLDKLEQEHDRANALHAQVAVLGRQCLEAGSFSPLQARQFRAALAELASIYRTHVAVEEGVVFPIAGRILSPEDKAKIAVEMAERRDRAPQR